MLAGSIATGRPATAPSHAAPTSDSSHTAIQPQTTTDAIVTRTTISTSSGSQPAMPYAPTTVPLTGVGPLAQRSFMADTNSPNAGSAASGF